MSLEQQQNAVPFIETPHWREAYHAPKKETPDFGEPWHDPFSSPNATAQINILNRHNELVRGRVCDQRKIECVNACAGMTDPAAEIAAMRAKIESLTDMLHNCANLRQIARTELSENIEVMREAIREAHEALKELRSFYIELTNLPPCAANAALAKLKPFLP